MTPYDCTETAISEAKVAEGLFRAFPFPVGKKLTHEECIKLRGHLPRLPDEELQFYLGQILQDLISSRAGAAFETRDLDRVLLFLDFDVAEENSDTSRKIWGEDKIKKFIRDAEYLRKQNRKCAEKFTPSQTKAIADWLELARTWPDTKYELRFLDSALAYWRKRAHR